MEKYKIIDKIMVSFITGNLQSDILFDSETKGTLERKGNTVWYVDPEGERHESITTANIIEVGLERKSLEKLDK